MAHALWCARMRGCTMGDVPATDGRRWPRRMPAGWTARESTDYEMPELRWDRVCRQSLPAVWLPDRASRCARRGAAWQRRAWPGATRPWRERPGGAVGDARGLFLTQVSQSGKAAEAA